MKKIDLLCVDDNEDFRFFLQRALEKYSKDVNYRIAENGQDFFEQLGLDGEAKVAPKLILLDINLPDANGIDVLEKLKKSKFYKAIPVVMLSTSDNPADIKKAIDNGANAFVSKPSSFNKLKELIADACDFWLNHNNVPNPD